MSLFNVICNQTGQQMFLLGVSEAVAITYCRSYNLHAQGHNPARYKSGKTYSVKPHKLVAEDAYLLRDVMSAATH